MLSSTRCRVARVAIERATRLPRVRKRSIRGFIVTSTTFHRLTWHGWTQHFFSCVSFLLHHYHLQNAPSFHPDPAFEAFLKELELENSSAELPAPVVEQQSSLKQSLVSAAEKVSTAPLAPIVQFLRDKAMGIGTVSVVLPLFCSIHTSPFIVNGFFSPCCHGMCLETVPRKKVAAEPRSSKAQKQKGTRSAKGDQSTRIAPQVVRDTKVGESDVQAVPKPVVESVGKGHSQSRSQKRKQQQQQQPQQTQKHQLQQEQQPQQQTPSPQPSAAAKQQNPKQGSQRHKQKSHASANAGPIESPQVIRIMQRPSSAASADTAPVHSTSSIAAAVSSSSASDSKVLYF